MSKLFWIKDVAAVMDRKIDKMTHALVEDTTITPEQAPLMVQQIRLFRSFADEVIEDMEREDREEEERYAAVKAAQAAAAEGASGDG